MFSSVIVLFAGFVVLRSQTTRQVVAARWQKQQRAEYLHCNPICFTDIFFFGLCIQFLSGCIVFIVEKFFVCLIGKVISVKTFSLFLHFIYTSIFHTINPRSIIFRKIINKSPHAPLCITKKLHNI